MKNVLIVEDESIVALEISSYVKELGYNVVKCVSSALSAIKIIETHTIDII